jgi:hypothetical protein
VIAGVPGEHVKREEASRSDGGDHLARAGNIFAFASTIGSCLAHSRNGQYPAGTGRDDDARSGIWKPLLEAGQIGDVYRVEPALPIHEAGVGDAIKVPLELFALRLVLNAGERLPRRSSRR